MSIDRKQIKTAFKEYTDRYDPQDPKIALKIYHTEKVAELSDRITAGLGMTPEEQDLAWAVAMLHDIGRFEQVRRFGTFRDDKSIDHAAFGADLLFREGLLDAFGGTTMTAEERDVLETAIRQHNKYRIETTDENRAKFCRVIRDADKLDILRVNVESPVETIYGMSAEELAQSLVTPAVMESFREGHCVSRDIRRTPVDNLVGHISFAFELEYPVSRRIALEQGYLMKILEFRSEVPETQRCFKEMRERMIEYFDESALEEARAFFGQDKFATDAAGVVIEKVGDKYALCSLQIGDIHRNALGAVMGGAMYTLADFCFAIASNFRQGPAVTVVSQISYLGQPRGDKLIAESRLLKSGRKTCFYDVDVRDEEGNVVAVVSFTGNRLEK